MAKMNNLDAARAAEAIFDKLDAIDDLNRSSRASIKIHRPTLYVRDKAGNVTGYNERNAKPALRAAEVADYMHYFCTNILK